jgi:hypothetical protein
MQREKIFISCDFEENTGEAEFEKWWGEKYKDNHGGMVFEMALKEIAYDAWCAAKKGERNAN